MDDDKTQEGLERFYSPDEVATSLGVSPGTVKGWIKKGILCAIRLPGKNGSYRIAHSEYVRLKGDWITTGRWPKVEQVGLREAEQAL